MVQVGPKECILISGDTSVDAVKLRQVINKTGVLVTERKRCMQSKYDYHIYRYRLKFNDDNSSSCNDN